MRSRPWALLGLASGLAFACAVACGRSGFMGPGGTTPTPSTTGTPWLGNYAWGQPILVNAVAALPAGYTVPFTLDHAALVTSGLALASGDDLRVACLGSAGFKELDRILDDASAWNTAATTVLFRTVAPVAVATTATYWLFYGDPAAANPPANPDAVFVFHDDFEQGLGRWTNSRAASWGSAGTHARSGSMALEGKAVNMTSSWVAAGTATSGALALADVRFDAWWFPTQMNNTWNLAQGLRAGPAATASFYDLETNLRDGPSLGLDLATYLGAGNTFTELVPPLGVPVANQWNRVTLIAVGGGMRILLNGMQVNPASGVADVSGAGAMFQSAGTVSFRTFNIPGGQSWWIDDVSVRRAVDPEPTVSLGPPHPRS